MHPAAKRLRDHKVSGNEETNKEYEHYGDGGFQAYFRNKQVKLDTQAKEDAQKRTTSGQPQIFSGCVVYITGYTKPSAAELKRLIVDGGGSICAFLGGKTYATHIIAESLTVRKIEQYANCKVVKPAWIVDSASAGKRLDWTRYRTISGGGREFFKPETTEITADSTDEEKARYIHKLREQVNCLAPNFVEDYYARSRLHFLSTSKVALRQRCRAAPLTPSKQRIILHIDYDSFFVSIALKKRPDLKDKPMCVSHGSSGSDIASCNYVAREKGVANGMWVGHARKLCPELECLPYDFAEYTRCSQVLYDTLLGLSPDYVTAVSVDEALVDVTNLASTPSEIEELALSIRNKVRSLAGIEVSIGAGPNILLAKVALRKAKPAGYHYIPEKAAIKELEPLSVDRLPGVGGRTEADLNSMGIFTVKDLGNWPLTSLQTKLGKVLGKKLANDAQGISSNDISQLDIPLKSVGVEICWGVRLVTQDEMDQYVRTLTAEFFKRLEATGMAAEGDVFTIKLYQRSPTAPFVTPKYFGCGKCDISSRSRRVSGQMTLEEWEHLVVAVVRSLGCPALEFRGLGLHVKFKEKDHEANLAISPVFSKPNSPSTGSRGMRKKMVALVPRKRPLKAMTLTQLNEAKGATPIDMAVFDNLPAEIRREILMNEQEFNVVLPTQVSRPAPAPTPFKPKSEQIAFLGTTNLQEIRALIQAWVGESSVPCAEDVAAIRDYVDDVIARDPDWCKAIMIVNWLGKLLTSNSAAEWHNLHHLLEQRVQKRVQSRV